MAEELCTGVGGQVRDHVRVCVPDDYIINTLWQRGSNVCGWTFQACTVKNRDQLALLESSSRVDSTPQFSAFLSLVLGHCDK
jgi:hypothetical protein